jgi:hypothetical protein
VTYPTPGYGPGAESLAKYRAEINQLHELCTALVDTIGPRLPEPDRHRLRTGLDVGEWMPLLDDLCAALVQDAIPVTAQERDQLVAALDLLGAGDITVPYLADRDATLAALTIES